MDSRCGRALCDAVGPRDGVLRHSCRDGKAYFQSFYFDAGVLAALLRLSMKRNPSLRLFGYSDERPEGSNYCVGLSWARRGLGRDQSAAIGAWLRRQSRSEYPAPLYLVWDRGIPACGPPGIAAGAHARQSLHPFLRLGHRSFASGDDRLCKLYCCWRVVAYLERHSWSPLQCTSDRVGLLAAGQRSRTDGDRSDRRWIGRRTNVGQPCTLDRRGSRDLSLLVYAHPLRYPNHCRLPAFLDLPPDRTPEYHGFRIGRGSGFSGERCRT